MRVKEQWKQPVKSSEAWKAILLTVVLLSGMLAFMQLPNHSHLERSVQPLALLIIWACAAFQVFKCGWRSWERSQTLFLVGYTFFTGGPLLPQGSAVSWLTNIGGLLLMGAWASTIFDFRKARTSASTDAVPPAA